VTRLAAPATDRMDSRCHLKPTTEGEVDRTPNTTGARDITRQEDRTHPAAADMYEPNPKHKLPWARGRRGSICPVVDAQALLATSETTSAAPAKRFATDGRMAFCGVQHAAGRWHGYPVTWKEVPGALRQKWLDEGRVKRSDVRAFWDRTP
jgi:hypothetical protein